MLLARTELVFLPIFSYVFSRQKVNITSKQRKQEPFEDDDRAHLW